jgi:EAL domain-containing protein (putative c-di-GMP-specific phosphodiesterase class I)
MWGTVESRDCNGVRKEEAIHMQNVAPLPGSLLTERVYETDVERVLALVHEHFGVALRFEPITVPRLAGAPGLPVETSDGRRHGWLSMPSPRGSLRAPEAGIQVLRFAARLIAGEIDRTAGPRSDGEEIQWVLDGREIRTAFQPIFDLATGTVVGAEALSRFPARPERPVDQWFTAASTVGLGIDLEALAVELALEQLVRLPVTAAVWVNVSADALCSTQLWKALEGVPLTRVVFELTEHVPVDDYECVTEAIGRLRARGGRLAVDDVGAGFATLRHIIRLAPDILKLDMSLVRGIDVDPVRRSLTASLIWFAAQIDAVVTAEGIETASQLEAIQGLGVAYAQGFYLALPREAAEVSGPHPWIDRHIRRHGRPRRRWSVNSVNSVNSGAQAERPAVAVAE